MVLAIKQGKVDVFTELNWLVKKSEKDLSGRKKYRESGEAGLDSCSHKLVKELICLWSCNCDGKAWMLCLEDVVLRFIAAE